MSQFTTPTPLTNAETLVQTAFRTRTYRRGNGLADAVSRPNVTDMVAGLTVGITRGDLSRFVIAGTDWAEALTWATMVTSILSEDRMVAPRRPMLCNSWEEVAAEVRRLVTESFETANAEAQSDLDEEPAYFAAHRKSAVVVDGKVTDAWGPALSGPVFWWLDNMTLVNVWGLYKCVTDAAIATVQEDAASWCFSADNGEDPRKVAHETFRDGMRMLERAIRDLLNP